MKRQTQSKLPKNTEKSRPKYFTETDLPLCRHEQLKGEEKATEDQIKVNAEAVESLVRILSKWQNFADFLKLKLTFQELGPTIIQQG